MVKMAYYNRNRNIKKIAKNNNEPNRELKMNCHKHGELISYSQAHEIVVYESLNIQKDIVEFKCFKCLEEETRIAKENYRSKYSEVSKQSYLKYGRNAKILDNISHIGFYICSFGFVLLLYLFGWLWAFVSSGILFIILFLCYLKSESLEKQFNDSRIELSKDLKYVSDARSLAYVEAAIVSKRRENKTKIKREKMSFSFEEIDKMTGIQFEEFVKDLLKKCGYKNVETTKASGDEGVDIIAYKSGKKIAIQCKRYTGKISNSAIQQVYSGKTFYDCQEAYVITNSQFTENAVTLAKKLKVKLIDRNQLFDMVEQVQGNLQQGKTEYQSEFKFDTI